MDSLRGCPYLTEQDREKFTQLVKALNDLLSVKDHRLEDNEKKND